MLRHAQHERNFLSDFSSSSVRPELVEGVRKVFSMLLMDQMKQSPKQIPGPNERRDDKPPEEQNNITGDRPGPGEHSQLAKDILIKRDGEAYAEIRDGQTRNQLGVAIYQNAPLRRFA